MKNKKKLEEALKKRFTEIFKNTEPDPEEIQELAALLYVDAQASFDTAQFGALVKLGERWIVFSMEPMEVIDPETGQKTTIPAMNRPLVWAKDWKTLMKKVSKEAGRINREKADSMNETKDED